MKHGQIQVTGVVTREKDGKKSYTLYGITPFEDWENGIGMKTVSEWTNHVDLSILRPNDVIVPVYSRGYEGKAIFTGFTKVPVSDK